MQRSRRGGLVLAAAVVILAAAPGARAQGLDLGLGVDRFATFVTILLGIVIEAVPFLLAGSLVSGCIEVFVGVQALQRLVPRRPVPAALGGSVLGLAFPVCECGVVPVTRRLYYKGLPLSAGIAFLLAAPVVNPVVILSTWAAFGWGPIFAGRLILTVVIATAIALLFALARPEEILRPEVVAAEAREAEAAAEGVVAGGPLRDRVVEALLLAGDDFIDMGRYLVFGAMIAAGMQTLVPQTTLLALGQGPVLSVVVMMLLAFVLSICSTVDAVIALAFAGTFTPAAILAFLVFGPMVDIKSAMMFLGVFRRRAVLYLVLLPLAMMLFFAVFLSLNTSMSLRW